MDVPAKCVAVYIVGTISDVFTTALQAMGNKTTPRSMCEHLSALDIAASGPFSTARPTDVSCLVTVQKRMSAGPLPVEMTHPRPLIIQDLGFGFFLFKRENSNDSMLKSSAFKDYQTCFAFPSVLLRVAPFVPLSFPESAARTFCTNNLCTHATRSPFLSRARLLQRLSIARRQ